MKTRNGWVSNSSSSSFIVAYGGDNFKKAFDYNISYTNAFAKIAENIRDTLAQNIDQVYTDVVEFTQSEDYENFGDDQKRLIIKFLSKGMAVGIGSLSDEDTYDDPMQGYLCNAGFQYESENLYINADAGY